MVSPPTTGAETERESETADVDPGRHPAPLQGKDAENGGQHERLNDSGRETLHHPPEDQKVDGRTRCAEEPSGRKDHEHRHERDAPPQPPGDPSAQELARGHRREVRGGEELGQALTDPERPHHVRHGHVHDGCGEHHRERRDHAGHGHHPPSSGCRSRLDRHDAPGGWSSLLSHERRFGLRPSFPAPDARRPARCRYAPAAAG